MDTNNISKYWESLDPQKRSKLVKFSSIGLAFLFLIILYYASGRGEEKVDIVEAEDALDIIDVGESRLEDDIRSQVLKERAEINERQSVQEEKLRKQAQEIKRQENEVAAMRSALDALMARGTSKPNQAGIRLPDGESGDSEMDIEDIPNAPVFVGGIGRLTVSQRSEINEPKKKTSKFYLPVSFMKAAVLTGLRAKTVSSASSTPEPIILRVQAPAILPNDLRKNLEGCLIVANGYGDLSSERIETKLVSINCLDRSGQLIIEEEIVGIVIDLDGVKGLSASPVSKMGVNLARIALAAVISGGSKAFSQDSEVVSVSPLGQTKSLDPSKIMQTAVGGAVSSAADVYAEIISDLARQQAPVLEMGSGKEVTVVLTQGVWLRIQQHPDLSEQLRSRL